MGISNLEDEKNSDENRGMDGFQETSGMKEPRLPVYSTSPKKLWFPIVLCIIFSGLLAIMINIAGVPISFGLDEEELGFGASVVNALIFIGIGGFSAFIMIKLVKKKGIDLLEKIMMGSFLILGIFIVYFYGTYGFSFLEAAFPLGDFWFYLLIAISIGLGVLLVYLFAAPKFGERTKNLVVVIYGVLIGSFLPLLLPTWTALLILIGFSLYDIYSVKRGPIKEMMDQINARNGSASEGIISDEDDSWDWSDITLDIGIGDLAFYSMLTSITLISEEFGGPFLFNLSGNVFSFFMPFMFTITGVLLGAFLSFQFVKRHKMIPGLPLSIFIGIGMLALSIGLGVLIF
ncbi:hypothetical protein GF325_16845 [Candidatus Bathyarchaeota archaeon]|nr:hypothetical protein [Candidatus Bathyarchaeota archaeon]